MPKGRRKRGLNTNPLIRSAEMVGWALGGLEREIVHTRERLTELNAHATKLRAQLGSRKATLGERVESAIESLAPRRKRRKMSAAGRKRISEMMKQRWAERKKNKK